MYDKIPLPTDSLYKFCALFALFLIIFSFAAPIYTTSNTNQLIFKTVVEIEALKAINQPTPVEKTKIAALQKSMEIAVKDRDGIKTYSLILAVLATLIGIFGFERWYSVTQPIADEFAKVQLEMAKLQLTKLQRELDTPSATPPQDSESNKTPQ
ncbi:hypothetical protein [Chitinibacter sp. S2-10]|uniref:hypothetical protein n=1 Tax=Chitinibacter sp. S2-10 TaxID=3373597 RepID=UPI0039773A99